MAKQTKTDARNVCEPSTDPIDQYREFWASAADGSGLTLLRDQPGRPVVLFTQHKIYRLSPTEAVALADQLRAAAKAAAAETDLEL